MKINRVHISDIIDARRMDPIFFRYGTMQFGRNFRLEAISTCIVDIQSGVGAGKKDQADKNNGIIQVRPTNIDRNGMLIFDKNIYVPFDAIMPSLQKDDVLFNNTNSQELVGKTAIYKGDIPYKFSNHITRIRVNKEKIIPEFLWLILNIYQQREIFYAICTNWNNQSGVGTELLKSIKIPLPEMGIQQKIVDIYTAAQNAKLQKDKEAKELLESIDDIVTQHLGIKLPERSDFSETKYFTPISKLIGQRYDPYFHNPYFEKAFAELAQSKYPLKKLGDISILITSGITPKAGGDAYTDSQNGIAFIRSGDIDINGNINFEELLYIKPEVHNKQMKSSKVYDNDIMIAIVGATIGQVGIYHSEKEANINQAIALVRLKDGYNPEYVKELIKSSIGQLNLDRLKRPVARANINLEEIASILIPIPEKIEVQTAIAKEIHEIRVKADAIKNEGSLIIDKAKATIEKMILG